LVIGEGEIGGKYKGYGVGNRVEGNKYNNKE
jgi:hypothetical protein